MYITRFICIVLIDGCDFLARKLVKETAHFVTNGKNNKQKKVSLP